MIGSATSEAKIVRFSDVSILSTLKTLGRQKISQLEYEVWVRALKVWRIMQVLLQAIRSIFKKNPQKVIFWGCK